MLNLSVTGTNLTPANVFKRLADWEVDAALTRRGLTTEGSTWIRRIRLVKALHPGELQEIHLGELSGNQDNSEVVPVSQKEKPLDTVKVSPQVTSSFLRVP